MDDYPSSYGDNADRYEFITELKPGVWKICRKINRAEYLALDVSDKVFEDPSNPDEVDETALHYLLNPAHHPSLLYEFAEILNHENLVSLVDWFPVQKTDAGGRFKPLHYTVWDYCDAGTLGNLLVEEHISIKDEIKAAPPEDDDARVNEYETDDIMEHYYDTRFMENPPPFPPVKIPKRAFLPESLCWHVLLSVLKALAWLHDGSRSIVLGPDGQQWEMEPTDMDWEPILHRDITPNNIFFSHPKRNEWYGTCKLGNYGSVFISNHYHGDKRNPNPQHVMSKALAPPKGKDLLPLRDLIELDAHYGYTYPQQPNQPYTIVSEWRAFGEIMQAMMIRPVYPLDGHLAAMRKRPVLENLKNADYSDSLKNVVVMLMSMNPDEKTQSGGFRYREREYITTTMCLQAWINFHEWRNSDSPEARKMIHVWEAVRDQSIEDLEEIERERESTKAVHDILQKQDRIYGDEY
ncbi:hypothetical protein AAE478_007794 [Parahypoxylon ruwenzoriense]